MPTYHLTQGVARIAGGASDNKPFVLESGATLPVVDVRYSVYGEPNEAQDNIILVCHALSGSSRIDQWWPLLLDQVFDLERDCVICFNVIGSCYGSTGPSSINPATGKPYGESFPRATVRDMVRAERLAATQLGIDRFKAVVGSSLGGMQALQWAIDYPEAVESCVAIGAAPLGAMALALNHLQRKALALGKGSDKRTDRSLALARAIAMISYKSAALFEHRHGRNPNRTGPSPFESDAGRFDIAGYLDHQGDVFIDRFDHDSYAIITHAMDLFDPARDYSSAELAFERVAARVLLIGIDSDWLFPAADVRTLHDQLIAAGVASQYHELNSDHGHDAFLAEPEKLIPSLTAFLNNAVPQSALSAAASPQGERNGTHG
jgi:homoserine O-acetyltransferase/O-succinyltransferase